MNLLQVTPFSQSDDSLCGPTCVRMVLDYFGIDEKEKDIADACDHTYEKGCDDAGMKKAFEHFGLGCAIFNDCDFDDIEYWVQKHFPVIVDWFDNGPDGSYPNGHSCVVVGIDRTRIHLMDPWRGAVVSMIREEFARVWFDWKGTEIIEKWEDMVIRQIIVAFPDQLQLKVNN